MNKEIITIDQGVLKEMISATIFAVSLDESRYVLNGMLFKIKDDQLTLVATDGRRLALFEKKLSTSINKTIQIIVPVKTIHELKAEAEQICGVPDKPKFSEEVVAVVKWVDGTVLDSIRRVIV